MSHGFPLFWHSRRETKTSSKIKLKTNSNSSPSLTFNSLLCISRVLHRTGNLLHRGSFNSLISSIKNQCQFNTCDLLILDFNLPGNLFLVNVDFLLSLSSFCSSSCVLLVKIFMNLMLWMAGFFLTGLVCLAMGLWSFACWNSVLVILKWRGTSRVSCLCSCMNLISIWGGFWNGF